MWLQVLIRHSNPCGPPVYRPGVVPGHWPGAGHSGHNGWRSRRGRWRLSHRRCLRWPSEHTQHLLHQLLERQQCTGFPSSAGHQVLGCWMVGGVGLFHVCCLNTPRPLRVCRQHGTDKPIYHSLCRRRGRRLGEVGPVVLATCAQDRHLDDFDHLQTHRGVCGSGVRHPEHRGLAQAPHPSAAPTTPTLPLLPD